jgi:hypothetical protein
MRLVVSFRVDIPDNPEAETSLRWFLMRWLARQELAGCIEQLLPPGIGCKVEVMGAMSPNRHKEGKKCKGYEYPKAGRSPRWLRLR